MSRPLSILLMTDEGWVPADDPRLEKIDGEPLTERHVAGALRELGHQVAVLGVGNDVHTITSAIGENPPDLVFNLVEQFRADRRLDKNVAGLLEMHQVPFTGSGVEGLMLCRDKGLCKQLLRLHRVQCPRFVQFAPGRRIRLPKGLPLPLIVKPQYEDASDGIAKSSVVNTEQQLLERVQHVHEHYQQVAIAEQYVEGRELYVALQGNKRLTVFPPRELTFGRNAADAPQIATGRVKNDQAYREKWDIQYGFAELEPEAQTRIARICRRAYRLLRLRDYGRVDLRLTPEGAIYVLEVNANPDLAYGEDFADAAEKAGIKYSRLIDRIVRSALRRYDGD